MSAEHSEIPASEALFRFIEGQERSGGAPPRGVRSWGELTELLRLVPALELENQLSGVASTFVVPTDGEDFERWNAKKRKLANLGAVRALAQAVALGEASLELRLAMQAYTGFGGMGDAIGVLEPPYPPEYVEASRIWYESVRLLSPVPAAAATIMERVKDQYFTPIGATKAAWKLVQRTNPNAQLILEPSAGIGRYVRTAPAGLDWILVELDTMLSDMLGYCFPEGEVHATWFEEYVKRAERRVDVVIGNPPYGTRPPEATALDLPDVTDMADYFTVRGMNELVPGGTLCFLVPLSFLTKGASASVRRALLRRAVFRGAAILPSKTFPSVTDGTFVIMLWTRREKLHRKLDPREEAVAQGKYLELDEAAGAICGGEWRDGWRGRYLHGTPDYTRVRDIWLAPAPELSGVEIKRAHGRTRADDLTEAAQVSAEQALEDRVKVYLKALHNDPVEATSLQPLVRQSLIDWLSENGNPHVGKGSAVLRSVINADGTLAEVIEKPKIGYAISIAPSEDATFAQKVCWWSERRGYATASDLGLSDGEAIEEALDTDSICIELLSEGPTFYARWAYYMGLPMARLSGIESALVAPGLDARLRARLEAQKLGIMAQWAGGKTLGEIGVTPRSPCVPLEALAEWATWHLLGAKSKVTPEPHVQLSVADGTMSVDTGDPLLVKALKLNEAYTESLAWLIGYYNRESMIDDLRGTGHTSRIYGKLGAKGAADVDKYWVRNFQDWLDESQWVATVENEYNSRFAPPLISSVPTDPVELAGQARDIELHPHQNQAVRRASLGGNANSALLAFDVGTGKTFTGIATAMRWVQTGAARRVLITVPPSVLAKWYEDAKRLFPKARIGLIGISPGKRGPRSDGPQERIEKWLQFSAGAYDFLLCGHAAFFQDLEPAEESVIDIISGLVWARKKLGKQIAKARRLKVQIEYLTKMLEAAKAAQTERAYANAVGLKQVPGYWVTHRDKKVIKLAKMIAETEAALSAETVTTGTDREIATVQQHIRALAASKPYRPSATEADDAEDLESSEEGEEEESSEDEGEAPRKRKGRRTIDKPKPGLISWETLGVDGLIVDEAHKFKNLWYPQEPIEYASKGQDVLFGTKSPWDMLLKCSSVHRRRGGTGGGVLFLTATPMTNSPLELYNLLCMVDPTVFEAVGVYTKEEFIERYWQTEVDDVVKPDGSMVPAKKLIGFQNEAELLAVTSNVLDRRSALSLVKSGWLKKQPEAERRQEMFERDPAQVALIRTIVSIMLAWSGRQRNKAGGDVDESDPSALIGVSENAWSVTPEGELIEGDKIEQSDAPYVLHDPETARKARSILRLVAMSMLDKVAIDPRLLEVYAKSQLVKLDGLREKKEKHDQWFDDKAAGKKVSKRPPKAPKWSDYITLEIAVGILRMLPISDVFAYYASRQIAPKIADMAAKIADNIERPGKGRCGHVVFCDMTDLHDQIKRAIVQATRGRISMGNIGTITGAVKVPDRLKVSKQFNGQDLVIVDGDVVQEKIDPTLDVVLGTSGAMAEGIDLQRRSCAVHHLNLPWEPATLHQRNGRAVRQGNLMGNVTLYYYLTSRTFDALRFDKVVNKAAWWNAIFEGASETSNPAVSADASDDFDEVILQMVIEDPDELARRIAVVRARRQAKRYEKRLERAQKDWVVLNNKFAQARSAVDPLRRTTYFAAAVRRRTAWEIEHKDYIVEGAALSLNDEVVACDFKNGVAYRTGMVFTQGAEHRVKITSLDVRSNDFIVHTRAFGAVYNDINLISKVYGSQPAAPWTYEEEQSKLLNMIYPEPYLPLASAAPDLYEHVLPLLKRTLELTLERSQSSPVYASVPVRSVVMLTGDNKLVIGTPISMLSTERRWCSVSKLAEALLEMNIVAAFPTSHPDAWAAWVSAVREDRVWAPILRSTTGAAWSTHKELSPPFKLRTEIQKLAEYSRAAFSRSLPREALKQRAASTGETE